MFYLDVLLIYPDVVNSCVQRVIREARDPGVGSYEEFNCGASGLD